jgi:DNA-binding MarR family transcriptional regulator
MRDKREISLKETGNLFGDAWKEAAGIGEKARHDVPSLMMFRLLRLYNQMISAFNTHIEKQFSLSLGEFRVLMTLGRMESAASHEIAHATGIGTMNISRAVASLTRKGQISATQDRMNKRRKILHLTDKGLEKFAQLNPTAEIVAKYMVEGISDDELRLFSRLVTRMIHQLEAEDENGKSIFLQQTRLESPSKKNKKSTGSP